MENISKVPLAAPSERLYEYLFPEENPFFRGHFFHQPIQHAPFKSHKDAYIHRECEEKTESWEGVPRVTQEAAQEEIYKAR